MKNKIYGLAIFFMLVGIYTHSVAQSPGDTMQIWVDGICDMCKERIEEVALSTSGIQSADWNIDSRLLSIVKNSPSFVLADLHKNLAKVGHDTKSVEATDAAYDGLHDCCKYRDLELVTAIRTIREKNKQLELQANLVHGVIVEPRSDGDQVPIIGATVQWLGGLFGTVTDAEGTFQIQRSSTTDQLIVSYVGYQSDTLTIDQEGDLVITMSDAVNLNTVEITHRKRSTTVSFIEPASIQYLSEKELLKAACCSLAESFETTPSVDVSFTDAVTGTRKIELLGLASPYLQITRENMPNARGLSALHGLTYTAGSWIEGIQLNTGAGSVVNGFESFTGQINVELWKPETAIPAYLNLYGNVMGRFEGNLNLNHSLNEKWHSGLLIHVNHQQIENDRNNDGFLDTPLGKRFIAANRWRFVGKNGWMGQAGIKGTFIENESGQLKDAESPWLANHNTNRIEGWLKTGYVFPSRPYSSIGFQFSAAFHDAESEFGLRQYDAQQQSVYANLIYQSLIVDSQHRFKTGISFQYDNYEEVLSEIMYFRKEWVPGAFFEYTFGTGEAFTAVGGIRADYHNNFGLFFTPRINLRYALNDQVVWRISGGRGQRTASIFSENIGFLASSRSIIVQSENTDTPYGLDAEVGWNVGTTIDWEYTLGERSGHLSLSYFHTTFSNQIIVDFDQDPQSVYFYNLDGQSFSNSVQAQVDFELVKRWDIRLAYRFNDVQVDYSKERLQKPLISRHRAFLNTGYATKDGWKFDGTLNWQGNRRIPSTESNPDVFRRDDRSPSFFLLNGQISKAWNKQWEVYLGGENLLNFRQDNPIIAADDPFGQFFDASLVWGPIFGRNLYMGMRYRFFGDKK